MLDHLGGDIRLNPLIRSPVGDFFLGRFVVGVPSLAALRDVFCAEGDLAAAGITL